MTPTIKRRIAREWLYFLGLFLFGLFVLPPVLTVLLGGAVSGFYSELVQPDTWLWLIVIAPYLLFQLIRSVIWARKAARNP